MINRRSTLQALAFGLSSGLGAATTAVAQDLADYPNKPVRLFVPYAAGGALDILARLLGEQIDGQMRQPIIVENRPGANGNLAMNLVSKAASDGYTIMIGANGLATNPSLYPKLSFDVLRDLAPVAYIGYAPLVVVVPASSPYESLGQLIAAAKAAPGKLTFASAGTGSSGHLAAEMLKDVEKIDILHIPYGGGAPAIVDLVAGRVSMMFLDPPQALPHIKAGRLKALAVGGERRLPLLPNVQTLSEAGVGGVEAKVWWGIVAPSNVPPAVIAKLNSEFGTALAQPSVKARFETLGIVSEPGSPAQFGQYLQDQTKKWRQVIQRAHIQLE